ncbi:myb-like protein A [Lucilia sericata]|uniref:myb-like protein A n=1 Tax=Lucilia sericata TaxID=13632 RepID=UPI0018A809E7|nr:myb-like protein A [Lucilia sericata]
MDSTLFKYKHQYQQQNQHFNISTSNSNNYSFNNNNNHNNNNQNSIFILNTATTNNILPNNPKLYYSDLNDNNVVSSPTSFTSSSSSATSSTTATSSVWSSASSTMCSPAAHAIQKLFNCSSNSLKLNHGNYSGIESKTFKSKSELLKKKSKFWKYLEGEANEKNNQRGIENEEGEQKKPAGKSLKHKSKYWSKSYENDNQNHQDLSELLEYSCSLCDNCRCMDCQIGYFDCENSDDSNSEYSFHLSAYEEDDDEAVDGGNAETTSDIERAMELKSQQEALNSCHENCCHILDNKQNDMMPKLRIDAKIPTNCNVTYCVCNDLNCTKADGCQQCFMENSEDGILELKQQQPDNVITNPDH